MICGLALIDPGACVHRAAGVVAGDRDPLCWDHRILASSRARGERALERAAANRLRAAGCVVPEKRPERMGVRA